MPADSTPSSRRSARALSGCLQRAGVDLGFPAGQTCCGQPLFNTGFRDLARAQDRRTLAVLEERRVPVIVPSGSCASMIRHGYLELLRDEPAALERLAGIGRRSPERSGGGSTELLGSEDMHFLSDPHRKLVEVVAGHAPGAGFCIATSSLEPEWAAVKPLPWIVCHC